MFTNSRIIPQRIVRLAQTRRTPFLVIDKKMIQHKFEQFQEAMPDVRLFYAVKTNSHRRIVEILHALGTDFEISSEEELYLLLRCGVSPRKIITSNPVKSTPFIEAIHSAGVEYLAIDSHDEINKISELAPGSSVYVRLSVSNEGSQWPLSKKFGVEPEEAIRLLVHAARRSLVPCGITFHVGSQCLDEQSWVKAIEKSKLVWDMAKREGIELKMLNIGGGFPIGYTEAVPSIDQIARVIDKTLKRAFPKGIKIFIEPGRAFVGEAGTLVSTVIAKAKRNGQDWLYLDVGVFNGLMESIGGIQYSMTSERDGPMKTWVLAGPSCDSMDVVSEEVELPDLEIGDKVYISSAGAYTTAYASNFNGLPIPKTYFV